MPEETGRVELIHPVSHPFDLRELKLSIKNILSNRGHKIVNDYQKVLNVFPKSNQSRIFV